MAETDMKLAKITYRTLLDAVAKNGWKCDKKEDELSIKFGVKGDNLHMDFIVFIDAKRQLVRLMSFLPLKFDLSKIVAGAIATSSANYALADGSFDLDVTSGKVAYRITTSYCNSNISAEAIMYILNYAAWAIDKFYSSLSDVANGKMNTAQFHKKFLNS